MTLIQNFNELARTKERRAALEIMEAGLRAIQPERVMEQVKVEDKTLKIIDTRVNLQEFDEVFLLGFGKGAAKIGEILSEKLGAFLGQCLVIDVHKGGASNMESWVGSHPFVSETNVRFTQKMLEGLKGSTEKTLVLVVVCGGGSALFEETVVPLEKLIAVNQKLQKVGANIREINTVRKHLSMVKGGGLAKVLYPARVVGLLFSDVPSNDPAMIASGPTVRDETTVEDAWEVVNKYHLGLVKEDLVETPKEDKYFERVSNIILLTNSVALKAMKEAALERGYRARIFSDRVEGEAKEAGRKLLKEAKSGEVLVAGGETTVTVKGNGKGGRNQELMLASIPVIVNQVVVAVNSDGWDNTDHAGAIADSETIARAKEMGLTQETFLANNNSWEFFRKTGDAIVTGRLPSNVSDLLLVLQP